MSALLAYMRRNAMFVTLFSVILACCIGFGIYTILQSEPHSAVDTPPQGGDEPQPSQARISSFEGTYGHDATVHLSWSIDRAESDVESVRLYQGEHQIGGEMKELSSFSMSESLYQFPSGSCTFTLKVNFGDGSEDSRDVSVFISKVMGISMKSETSDNGILLKLSYIYDENNPVDVPRVKFITGSNNPFTLSYQTTEKSKSGAMIHAETIYKLNTDQLSAGSYPVTIRWIFDGANISKDFDIVVEK